MESGSGLGYEKFPVRFLLNTQEVKWWLIFQKDMTANI